MSAARGKRSSPPRRPDDGRGGAASGAGRPAEPGGRVPDLLRRVVGLGFSGFFMTEEVVRRALGETLPREWVEFAAQQSERTRRELIDRVAGEIGRTLESTNLSAIAERLLRGHTLEVSARIRLVPHEETRGGEPPRPAPDEQEPGATRSLRVTVRAEEGER